MSARSGERPRVEWRRSWPEVWSDDFLARWTSVQARAHVSTPGHQPALVRAWSETCGAVSHVEPALGWVRWANGQEAILPWVIVSYPARFGRRRWLEPAGSDLFGYHDPLITGSPEDVDWPAFWSEMRRSLDGHHDEGLFRFVRAPYARGLLADEPGDACPVLDLAGVSSLDALLARCSANHRGDVRRRLRRLRERGETTLWVATPAEVDAATDEVEQRMWPAYLSVWGSRDVRNQLLRPGIEAYVRQVIRSGLAHGWAHLSTLKVDGVSVAWHLGFIDRGQLHWWLPAHDPLWEPWSPGKVLLAHLLERGLADGWQAVHFLAGDQAYKRAWGAHDADMKTVRWHAPGLAGTLRGWYDAARRQRA